MSRVVPFFRISDGFVQIITVALLMGIWPSIVLLLVGLLFFVGVLGFVVVL